MTIGYHYMLKTTRHNATMLNEAAHRLAINPHSDSSLSFSLVASMFSQGLQMVRKNRVMCVQVGSPAGTGCTVHSARPMCDESLPPSSYETIIRQ